MSDRIATDIEVEVIDLKHVKDYVFQTYREQRSNDEGRESYDSEYDDVVGFKFSYEPFARFVTRDRSNRQYFILNTNGEIEQTTSNAPSYWDMYEKIREGAGYEAGMPSRKVGIFPSDIQDVPVIEVKNLAEFVRSFGSSVEARYNHCRKLLEAADE